MTTFFKWLIAQDYRKDMVGDLSRYIIADKELPLHKTKHLLLNHIIICGRGPVYQEAFHKAWIEYKLFRKIK